MLAITRGKKPTQNLMRNLELQRTIHRLKKGHLFPFPKNHTPSRCINQWKNDENIDFLQILLIKCLSRQKSSPPISSGFLLMRKFKPQYLKKKKSLIKSIFLFIIKNIIAVKSEWILRHTKMFGIFKDVKEGHCKWKYEVKLNVGTLKPTWILRRLFQGTCRYKKKWKVLGHHINEATLC